MVDGDPREGQYSIVGLNMLLCAHTRPKEVLVLSLGGFHIRSNCPLLGVVPKSDIFPFPGMRAYREKGHAEGTLLEGKSAHLSIYD